MICSMVQSPFLKTYPRLHIQNGCTSRDIHMRTFNLLHTIHKRPAANGELRLGRWHVSQMAVDVRVFLGTANGQFGVFVNSWQNIMSGRWRERQFYDIVDNHSNNMHARFCPFSGNQQMSLSETAWISGSLDIIEFRYSTHYMAVVRVRGKSLCNFFVFFCVLSLLCQY